MGGIDLAQAIPPIATQFLTALCLGYLSSVCLSVTPVPLLKPFDGFRCHFAEYTCGSNDTLLDGSPWPQRKGRFGMSSPSQNMPLQIVAATWRIQSRSWVDSDSTFYQITVVLVTSRSTSTPSAEIILFNAQYQLLTYLLTGPHLVIIRTSRSPHDFVLRIGIVDTPIKFNKNEISRMAGIDAEERRKLEVRSAELSN